jgi:hypothetical protein
MSTATQAKPKARPRGTAPAAPPAEKRRRHMTPAVSVNGSVTTSFIIPDKGLSLVRDAVKDQGSNFSIFVRQSLREKLERMGKANAHLVTSN